MNRQIPIITKVEFFDTSYIPIKANETEVRNTSYFLLLISYLSQKRKGIYLFRQNRIFV